MSDDVISVEDTINLRKDSEFCEMLHATLLDVIDYVCEEEGNKSVALIVGVLEVIKQDIINSMLLGE